MAKRFTDTAIWDKAWFRKLSPRLKEAWRFLCDKCDNAGVWEVDFDAMAFNVGERVTADDLKEALGDRIQVIGDNKIYLTGFVQFQYKTDISGLNPDNNAHLSVINRLSRLGIIKPLISPSLGALDKDKDLDKEKEKEERANQIFLSLPIFTQEQLCARYRPKFLAEGLGECVLYHSSDLSSQNWPAQKWGKVITSWMLEKKRREEQNKPDKKAAGDICGVAD